MDPRLGSHDTLGAREGRLASSRAGARHSLKECVPTPRPGTHPRSALVLAIFCKKLFCDLRAKGA